jgi:DNA-binding CsgD family transcriptional regulator
VDRRRDPVRAGLLHERLGRYLWLTADQAALSAYEEAVRLVPAEPPSAERARVLAGYAQILGLLGRDKECRQAAEAALAAARQVGARREEGRALALLGFGLVDLGDIDGGLAQMRDAQRIAEEQADVDGLGWASVQLAWASEMGGLLEEALAFALDGAEASRRFGATSWCDAFLSAAAVFEFLLGRWDEADRHSRAVLERDRLTGPKGIHTRLERARLDIARGDFAAARRRLLEAGRLAVKGGQAHFEAQFAAKLAVARAELALWEGHEEEASQAAAEGLDALARAGYETDVPVLFALGLAAAADRAEQASARRATGQAEAARRDGDELLARLEASSDPPHRGPETAAVQLQCRAEHTRLYGRPDPTAWAAAAAGWERLGRPYPAACARFREAEALLTTRTPRARVEEVLRAAHETTARLGAAPLQREIELLARRGRIRLQAPAEATPAEEQAPSVADSLGLTRRELEVLQLVAAGRTNRQIGQELFITPKTASIHVSRVLAKLGVAGRARRRRSPTGSGSVGEGRADQMAGRLHPCRARGGRRRVRDPRKGPGYEWGGHIGHGQDPAGRHAVVRRRRRAERVQHQHLKGPEHGAAEHRGEPLPVGVPHPPRPHCPARPDLHGLRRADQPEPADGHLQDQAERHLVGRYAGHR